MEEKVNLNKTCNSCDYTEFLAQYKRNKPTDLVYGKEKIRSYEYYDLIDNGIVDEEKVSYLYTLFLYNLKVLTDANIFEKLILKPSQIVTATKGVFWDWSSESEKDEVAQSILDCNGFYFPIFVLPIGIPHNQIKTPKNMSSLYNTYDGNHRVAALQYLISCNKNTSETDFVTKVFGYPYLYCIKIPEFCEKSCTGFKYTPVIYENDGPVNVAKEHLLDKPINLFHLNRCSDEMKIYIMNYEKECWDIPLCRGVDLVKVQDYQFAFRILQEFQNVLEYPLTYYYHNNRTLPEDILNKMKVVNNFSNWTSGLYESSDGDKVCPFMKFPICIPNELVRKECNLSLCCRLCDRREICKNKCPN